MRDPFAIGKRRYASPTVLIHHETRGCEYCIHLYQSLLDNMYIEMHEACSPTVWDMHLSTCVLLTYIPEIPVQIGSGRFRSICIPTDN